MAYVVFIHPNYRAYDVVKFLIPTCFQALCNCNSPVTSWKCKLAIVSICPRTDRHLSKTKRLVFITILYYKGLQIMDAIHTDVSNEALVTSICTNLCDFFRHTSRSNPREHFENERFTRWHTPFPHPWLNGVLCWDLPRNGVRSFIAESIRYFHDKAVNTFTWWTAPHLRASDWESVLSGHNFGLSRDTLGMAVDLHEMNGFMPQVDGLEICPVEDEHSLRMWAKVFTRGYGLPPEWELITFDLWRKLGLDFPIRNYLGTLNGEPVSTSSLFIGGGVAGVYCVSTLPWERGRGLGTALMVKPLRDARELGYRVGVLHTSGMQNGMYKKLGGRHLCQIENYYLTIL